MKEAILGRYNVEQCKLIYAGSKSAVYLLVDMVGKKYVLKHYFSKYSNLRKEKAFYDLISRMQLKHLVVPELFEAGQDYLISEYIEREYLTRDTVLDRKWTDEDVSLWVDGIIEFQSISLNRKAFSWKEQLAGVAYPAFKTMHLLNRAGGIFSSTERAKIHRLVANYILVRPFFRNVTTHYDFQTYNYTFTTNARSMSLLDFEFSCYLGDPLFDLAYYCTIPVASIDQWTLQKKLISQYTRSIQQIPFLSFSWTSRLRLILLYCNTARYLHFQGDENKQAAYRRSIRLLLDGSRYALFLHDL